MILDNDHIFSKQLAHKSLISLNGEKGNSAVVLARRGQGFAQPIFCAGTKMNKTTRLFPTIKGITTLGLTSLGLICLSSQSGIAGTVLAFFCIYLAFFASETRHHSSGY